MNKIMKLVVGLLALSGQLCATTVTLKSSSTEKICVTIDKFTELCVSANAPKSIDLNQTETHKFLAVDEKTGTIAAGYDVVLPKGNDAVEIAVEKSGNAITLRTTNQNVQLIKD